jgi:hypothetical protein
LLWRNVAGRPAARLALLASSRPPCASAPCAFATSRQPFGRDVFGSSSHVTIMLNRPSSLLLTLLARPVSPRRHVTVTTVVWASSPPPPATRVCGRWRLKKIKRKKPDVGRRGEQSVSRRLSYVLTQRVSHLTSCHPTSESNERACARVFHPPRPEKGLETRNN